MRRSVLALALLLVAGCGSDDSVSGSDSELLFGRWSSFSPRFSGSIVVALPSGRLGRTEREYIYQMRHNVSADHAGERVTITYQQILSGPETDRVYKLDGSLDSRKTGDIVTRLGSRERFYDGVFEGGEGEFTATDEEGFSVLVKVTTNRVRFEFENHDDLFYPFVSTFYDYSGGSPESTPFRDHFLSDPYVVEISR